MYKQSNIFDVTNLAFFSTCLLENQQSTTVEFAPFYFLSRFAITGINILSKLFAIGVYEWIYSYGKYQSGDNDISRPFHNLEYKNHISIFNRTSH